MTPSQLPGVFRVLVERDLLALADPAVVRLAELMARDPEAFTFIRVGDERLEQRGWPVAHDLALALRACDRAPLDRAAPLVAAALATAARVLDDPHIASEPIARDTVRLDLLALYAGGVELEQILTLAPRLSPRPDPGLREFLEAHALWSREHAGALAVLAALARTGLAVVHGWFAYDAHRRYPSSAARSAADLVVRVLPLAGPGLLADLLAHGLVLAASR
ncbi:MAG: hypothetical protein JNL82_19345 [Myxococcales bacterium]|nr:hypothetical protein [Myxococcales bacterium]